MKRLLAFAFLSSSPGADDFILKNGEVIEGKIDQGATNAANRTRTDPASVVLVVSTDEKGTKREIRRDEIKHVVSKKTSWELRREALDWYSKAKDRVKDSASGWESFGRQCRSRRLDEQADAAFRRAYELKATEGDPLALVKWCQKVGLPEEAAEQTRLALDRRRAELDREPDAAKRTRGRIDLAATLRRNGLEEEALKVYEELLATDPANATARAAAEELRESAGIKLKAVLAEWEKAGRVWKFRVAIEDDASAKVMETWKGLLERLSAFIFEATEGQFFVSEWILENQTSNGKIIVDKGKLEWESMQGPQANGVLAYCQGPGLEQWVVHGPGKTWEAVLCHEMFHGVFGLLDEYYQNPMCPCIMRAAPNPQKICGPSNHVGGGMQREPCWDAIKKRHTGVVSPNPSWKYTKEGIKGKGGAEEVDGELTVGSTRLVKPPVCNVTVIDH